MLRLLLLSLSLLTTQVFAQAVNDTATVAAGSVYQTSLVTARATANRTSCVAPCAVFFDATETTRAGYSTEDDYLSLDYRWNFDDTGAGNWARGARYRGGYTQSKNVEYGFVVAHVFETAGTYDVQLLVSDGTNSDTLNTPITVTVTAADTQWSGTNTICVSSTGTPVAGTGGCPSGAAVANATSIATIMGTTCNVDTAAVRCLLKGGDTFTSTGRADLGTNTGPAMIGSYGTGKAVITHSGSQGVFEVGQTTDLRISDLEIVMDAVNSNASEGAVYVSQTTGHIVQKLLLSRLRITNGNTGIYFRSDYTFGYHPVTNMHDGITIYDTVVTEGSGAGGNDYFLMGKRFAMIGSEGSNKKVPSLTLPIGEHVIRSKYLRKGFISHNDFGLLDDTDPYVWGCSPVSNATTGGWVSQGNTILKFVTDFTTDMPTEVTAAYSGEAILQDNYISKCRHNTMDVAIGPVDETAEKASEHHEYWVVEGNHWVSDKNHRHPLPEGTSGGSGLMLRLMNTSHVAVRNNVFDVTLPSDSLIGGNRAIQLMTNSAQVGQPNYLAADDVRIYNNVMYQGTDTRSSPTRILFADNATDVTDVVAKNNYTRSAYSQAVVYNPVPTTVGFALECCGCTASTAGTCSLDSFGGTSPLAGTPGSPSTLDDFELLNGGPADDVGTSLPGVVSRDAADRCRADGQWDYGPMERAATECAGP